MKYTVNLFYSGKLSLTVEAPDDRTAPHIARDIVDEMSDKDFVKKAGIFESDYTVRIKK